MTDNNSTQYITNLIDSKKLQKEFKLRNPKASETIEIPQDVTNQEALELQYGKGNVKYVKSRKIFKCTTAKEKWKQFEDKVWRVLYRMGFDFLNEGVCKIALDDQATNTKQIDVLAKSDNIVCVIECKDSNKHKKPIKYYLNEFAGVKSKASDYIRKYFDGEKVTVRWIMATSFSNYESGAEELAKQHGIWLINNWDYYEDLVGVLGNAAKYQFLANIMNDREIPNFSPRVYALSGSMAKLQYYQFSIKPDDLMKMSFVPHSNAESEANYDMYQRLVKPGRVAEIQEYIKGAHSNPKGVTVNGLFPTNIVVNFKPKRDIVFEPIKYDVEPKPGILHLPNYYGSAIIIDGQHRLFSYANTDEAKTEMIPVIAFVNLSPSQQADIFYHINGKQEKVSKNLLNQIICIQDWKSTDTKDRFYALPFEVIMELNDDTQSPFYHKIKMEGGRLNGTVSMTYAEVSDHFAELQFFSKEKVKRKGKTEPIYHLVFYNTVEETLTQAKKLLNSFFDHIIEKSERVKADWKSSEKTYFDSNSVVIPLLMVLKDILEYIFAQEDMRDKTHVPVKDYLSKILEFGTILCNYFDGMTTDELEYFKLSAGGKGYSIRHDCMIEAINKEKPDFMKEHVAEIIKRRLEEQGEPSTDVRKFINELENKMRFIFTRVLMDHYGSKWYRDALPKDVRDSAQSRNMEKGIIGPEFLLKGGYIIDLKKIIDFKDNYNLLEKYVVFENNTSIKKNDRSNWIVKLNEYRNDIMHNDVVDGTSEFEKREKFIKEKLEQVNPLFDEFIDSNGLEEEWTQFITMSPADDD